MCKFQIDPAVQLRRALSFFGACWDELSRHSGSIWNLGGCHSNIGEYFCLPPRVELTIFGVFHINFPGVLSWQETHLEIGRFNTDLYNGIIRRITLNSDVVKKREKRAPVGEYRALFLSRLFIIISFYCCCCCCFCLILLFIWFDLFEPFEEGGYIEKASVAFVCYLCESWNYSPAKYWTCPFLLLTD